MSGESDKIDALKLKLRNVTKIKLSKEREVLKLRNKERSLSDDIKTMRAEVDYLSDQLVMLRKQLTQSKHHISLIEICTISEEVKIGAHTGTLKHHLEGFQKLFDKEQKDLELRIKEQRAKEAEQLELVRKKEMQLAEENDRQAREVVAVEEECTVIERECAVLKKRNNAILLKLRRKLLEAENIRRDRMKPNSDIGNIHDTK